MRRERPGVVTAAAILDIVFGAMGLLCGLCGLASAVVTTALMSSMGAPKGPNAPGNPFADMEPFLAARIPAYHVYQAGKPILDLVLGGVVLCAGIGLLRMKRWARLLTFIYAALVILVHVGDAIFSMAYVIPATEAWQEHAFKQFNQPGMPPMASNPMGSMASNVSAIIGALFYIIGAIVVVALLLMPGVSAAFAGAGPAQRRHEDDEDYDDEDDEDDHEDDDRERVRRRDRD